MAKERLKTAIGMGIDDGQSTLYTGALLIPTPRGVYRRSIGEVHGEVKVKFRTWLSEPQLQRTMLEGMMADQGFIAEEKGVAITARKSKVLVASPSAPPPIYKHRLRVNPFPGAELVIQILTWRYHTGGLEQIMPFEITNDFGHFFGYGYSFGSAPTGIYSRMDWHCAGFRGDGSDNFFYIAPTQAGNVQLNPPIGNFNVKGIDTGAALAGINNGFYNGIGYLQGPPSFHSAITIAEFGLFR